MTAHRKTTSSRFLRLYHRAFAEIPRDFRELIVNLDISVKASPGREAGREKGSKNLLGLYSGLSRAEMAGPDAPAALPARIFLYRRNIESHCRDESELLEAIRTTLRHELAHHFGFSDEDLRRKWPEGA